MRFFQLVMVSAALLLVACRGEALSDIDTMTAGDSEASPSLRGEVLYMDRRALSDQAELIVQLDEAGEPGPVVASLVLKLEGRQVPVEFDLPLPDGFDRSRPVRLRAAILEPGGPVRIGSTVDAFTVDEQPTINQLLLRFIGDDDYQAAFQCDETRARVVTIGDRLILSFDDVMEILTAVPAASGARYRNEKTDFWMHQGGARLSVDGREFPECRRIEGTSSGAEDLVAGLWQVTEIDGEAPVADTSPELRFLADESRLAATAGCNRFGGQYSIDGQSIDFGPLMSTLMACPNEAVSELERQMVDALGRIDRFEIGPGPELRLIADDQVRFRARLGSD